MTPTATAIGVTQSAPSSAQIPSEEAFIVELNADGSAQVSMTTTFNLTTESGQQAFAKLRNNETARESLTNRFATRMRAIAARTENATGRTMEVHKPTVTFMTQNETGIVALSVTWNGLAATADDRLVLKEPFNSGFDLNRAFTVVGPDGYELETVSPSPTTRNQGAMTWDAERNLDGFEATFAPAEKTAQTETGDGESGVGAPGFSVGTGVLALLISTLLVQYRYRREKK